MKTDDNSAPPLKYSWLHPFMEVRHIQGLGKGVFSRQSLRKGDLVAIFGGFVVHVCQEANATDDRAIQIHDNFALGCGEGEIEPTEFFNHSCDPNTGFGGQIFLICLKDILPNDEITFDYAMVLHGDSLPEEYGFTCRCGSPMCRGNITAHDWKRPELQDRYLGHFQYYLQEKIKRLKDK